MAEDKKPAAKKTAAKKTSPKKTADKKPAETESVTETPAVIPNPEAPHVYQAINQVQDEISKIGIAKAQENETDFYLFRGIDDVYNTISKMLAKAGLMTIPNVTSHKVAERKKLSGYVLFHTVLEIEYDLISMKDGSIHTSRVIGEAMSPSDKGTSMAMSDAYKNLCFQLFCIPTEGENDTQLESHGGIKPAEQIEKEQSPSASPKAPPTEKITVEQAKEYIAACDRHEDLDFVYNRAKASKIDKQLLNDFRTKREELNQTIGEKPKPETKTNQSQRG